MSIDRRTVVRRHNPQLEGNNPQSPLSVGNGRLCYTADGTGFQTFDGFDPDIPGTVPLCTMSEWGFHSYPSEESRDAAYARLRRAEFRSGKRSVGYMSDRSGQESLFEELRVSPHRANLVKLALGELDESTQQFTRLLANDCSAITQNLDLWDGILSSSFDFRSSRMKVQIVCHPTMDAISFSISIADGAAVPAIALSFPCPSHDISGSDWSSARAADHRSGPVERLSDGSYMIRRQADDLRYSCVVCPSNGILFQTEDHMFVLAPAADTVHVTMLFIPADSEGPTAVSSFESCREAAAEHRHGFWTTGAFIELAGSRDPRALELERRIILSRYLTSIQCSGELPPAETGLTCNSWYGKFHLEMHPWHALHFPLWNQTELLERSFDYYHAIMQAALDRAAEQHYRGLRWPKMTDPSGLDSPSEIGTLLCWQQPHFVVMAELVYQSHAGHHGTDSDAALQFLLRHAAPVFESAEFMADFARFDERDGSYHLGPPVIPAQENHPPESTRDPVFELEYWRLGLSIAAEWKERLAEEVPTEWERVRRGLAALPVDPATGDYASHAMCPDTYGEFAHDHPAMLLALSYFAGDRVDSAVMSRSLDLVAKHWEFDSAWGWDFPVMAMCAARLGRPHDALEFLTLRAQKNTYRANGHNAQLPRGDLPLYLPGNGALLLAVAVMAGGWPGSGRTHPGFPDSDEWVIESEGFCPVPF